MTKLATPIQAWEGLHEAHCLLGSDNKYLTFEQFEEVAHRANVHPELVETLKHAVRFASAVPLSPASRSLRAKLEKAINLAELQS